MKKITIWAWNILVGGFILSALGVCCWIVCWLIFYSEIRIDQYQEVQEWSKSSPRLHIIVGEATWDDDVIDQSEYRYIRRMSEQFKKEKMIRDARGENNE